jgi:hypothetical protein
MLPPDGHEALTKNRGVQLIGAVNRASAEIEAA